MGEPIPVRSRLLLRVDRISVSGSATVKNIARGCKYVLGLNLSQTQPAEVLALVEAA